MHGDDIESDQFVMVTTEEMLNHCPSTIIAVEKQIYLLCIPNRYTHGEIFVCG